MANWAVHTFVATTSVLAAGIASAAPPTLVDIGNGNGMYSQVYATCMTPDGKVIAGQVVANRHYAFRWSELTGFVVLTPQWAEANCTGISDDGQTVVGWYRRDGRLNAMRWSVAEGLQDLSSGALISYAVGLSGSGQIVAGWASPVGGPYESWRWTSGDGFSTLPVPGLPANSSVYATSLSSDGSVLTGRADDFSWIPRGFLWDTTNGVRMLESLSPSLARAFPLVLSRDGETIGGYLVDGSGQNIGFLWSAASGIRQLSPGLVINALSSDASIAVGQDTSRLPWAAFLWTPDLGVVRVKDRLTALGASVTGWDIESGVALTSDGSTILCNGRYFGENRVLLIKNILEPRLTLIRDAQSQAASPDGTVSFTVLAQGPVNCPTPVSYQWQRRNPVAQPGSPSEWIDLTETPDIFNPNGTALVLQHVTPSLATGFRCKITSPCTTMVLYSAEVNFSVSCPADFNADGGVDFQDVEAFFTRWENGC